MNSNKYHFHGVSGGSWCSLIYHLENDLTDHDRLWNTYIGNESTIVKIYDMKSMEHVHKKIGNNVLAKYKDTKNNINIPISIYVTKIQNKLPKNIVISEYNNLEEAVNYATCSSYIPFICGKGIWTKYENNKYIDGVFFHKKPKVEFDICVDANKIYSSNKNSGIDQRICLDINKSRKMFQYGWEYAKQNFKNDKY